MIICIVASIGFIYLIAIGLFKKSFWRVISAFVFLLIAVGSFFLLGVYAAGKASSKLTRTVAIVTDKFKPRTGTEIYNALLGQPIDTCTKVINQTDQVIPKLDCCIWLEFKTCPAEINRIVAQQYLQSKKYAAVDSTNYMPNYGPKPFWWRPQLLGDSVIVSQNVDLNPNREKILIYSKDSLYAFYSDMAD